MLSLRRSIHPARHGPSSIWLQGDLNPKGERACVCFVRRDDIPGKPIEPYTCTPHDNTLLSDGKTPMICTPGTDPFVFYFAGGLNKTCPSCDFAERIRKHAEAHPPPYFITTYVRSCQRQADR
jgi:hypothetical protein